MTTNADAAQPTAEWLASLARPYPTPRAFDRSGRKFSRVWFDFPAESEQTYRMCYDQLTTERAQILERRANGNRHPSDTSKLSALVSNLSDIRAYAKIRGFTLTTTETS